MRKRAVAHVMKQRRKSHNHPCAIQVVRREFRPIPSRFQLRAQLIEHHRCNMRHSEGMLETGVASSGVSHLGEGKLPDPP